MRHNSYEKLQAPRAVQYFPSLKKQDFPNLNVYMFTEDVRLAVMPIRGGGPRSTPDFSVEIQGGPEHETRASEILKSLSEHNQPSLAELLSAAVETIAIQLARNGRAVYEIVQDERGDACQLHGFTSQRLFRFFGRYIQIIPKADRVPRGKIYVIIPERDVWGIAMPQVLGGCRGYRAMLRRLAGFQHLTPSFLTNELSRQQGWPPYYDYQRYVRESELFVAKLTARWGWNQRDSGQRSRTEFYWFYRTLQFNWAQACLREHIVKELNRLFRRLGIEAEIVVKGLPTASEILAIRQRMCEGHISFSDAYDACSV